MSSILTAITSLVTSATGWAAQFCRLFFTYSTGADPAINGLSFLGLCCIAVPLVGLGIGIIKRLVRVRA